MRGERSRRIIPAYHSRTRASEADGGLWDAACSHLSRPERQKDIRVVEEKIFTFGMAMDVNSHGSLTTETVRWNYAGNVLSVTASSADFTWQYSR